MKITVNGVERAWSSKMISYEDILKLTYGVKDNAWEHALERSPTVTFSKKQGKHVNVSGSLVAGESVAVDNFMIIDVADTSGA